MKIHDELYPKQWNLKLINVRPAWEVTMGKGAVVGLIDSGIDPSHVDLGWPVAINIAAYNTIAQVKVKLADVYDAIDKQTHSKFLSGWNYFTNSDFTWDRKNHGTAMAGIIGAELDGVGIVGVAPECKIRPYVVLTPSGGGHQSIAARAVNLAVDDGVDVINMSLQYGYKNGDMEKAVERAVDANIPVVAAMGNYASFSTRYPAGYPGVIAVAGVMPSGKRWMQPNMGSNYGPHVWCAAPAAVQTSTRRLRSRYSESAGTSLATAHISGLCALIKSIDKSLTVVDILILLQRFGNQSHDQYLGYGVPDVAAMVSSIRKPSKVADRLTAIGNELLEIATELREIW